MNFIAKKKRIIYNGLVMRDIVIPLLHGSVIHTDATSVTGPYLYSDFASGPPPYEKNSTLNQLVKIPLVGIVAAVARITLSIIHIVGHLIAFAMTWKKGHLAHAAKGGCELSRGSIEFIPIVGRVFANLYSSPPIHDPLNQGCRSWWMLKIYNPQNPDGLDLYMNNWVNFPKACTFYA